MYAIKSFVRNFFIFSIALIFSYCNNSEDFYSGDNNDGKIIYGDYNPMLEKLPNVDLSNYDLSIKQNKSGYIDNTSLNDSILSSGACVAKSLRNMAIRMSSNIQHGLAVIQEIDRKCSDFRIDSIDTYYKFTNFAIPLSGENPNVSARVRLRNNIIQIDMNTGSSQTDERDLQIYIDRVNNEDDSTFVIEVVHYYIEGDPVLFETYYMRVDTREKDLFVANFKRKGQGVHSDGVNNFTYLYKGDFVRNSQSKNKTYNVSDFEYIEDFALTGGGYFKALSWSKFDQSVGSSKYTFINERIDAPEYVECWNVESNEIVSNEESPYFKELEDVSLSDLDENFTVDFLEESNEKPWDGSIPKGYNAIEIDINNINLRDPENPFTMPVTSEWLKYEDVSGCIDPVNETFENMD